MLAVRCRAVTYTPTPTHPPAPTGRRIPIWAVAAAVLAAAAITAGVTVWATSGDDAVPANTSASAPATTAPPAVVRGSISLGLGDFTWQESPIECSGRGGYDDIGRDTPVTVTDPAGKVIGLGVLNPGIPVISAAGTATGCNLAYTVEVPAGLGFYGVEVSHRGAVKVREADLGDVQLTLG